MANCSNPIFINTADVDYFGFNTTFNPYAKSITFDISGLTTFKTDGEDNITSIVFDVIDPNENVYQGTINPSLGEVDLTISGLEQGELYFGQYHIKATITQPATSDEPEDTFVIEFDVNVCYDPKLNNKNLAEGCAIIEVDCGTATMVIKEGVSLKFAGKQVADINGCPYITTLGTVNYPIDPETSAPFLDPVTFTYTPYQLSLANAITGLYSIALITTAYYDLGCNCVLAIQYRSNVNKEVLCGNGMCEITCCMVESLDIIQKGGSKGAQMEELYAQAMTYYVVADQLASCGKNNDKYVKKVKEILNCDCKCETKSLLIQPNPITFGASNLIPSCGTTITKDQNGDYIFHSFVYKIEAAEGEDKISFETVQPNACTKLTYATIHCDKIEQCIYDILATDPDILNQWITLFDIHPCPCDGVDIINTPEVLEVQTLTEDFVTLEDTYFVKSDVVTGVKYKDNTVVTGATLSHIKYIDQLINQQGLIFNEGDEITLPCTVCGGTLAEKTGYHLITEATTTCSCTKVTDCELSTPRVNLSERYTLTYRINPQIEDYPVLTYSEIIDGDTYTMNRIYFSDSDDANNYASVRAIIFKTDNVGNTTLHETRTIIGANTGDINNPTINNTWGNFVNLNRPSSINLDFNEIVNGEPVLYFVTFGGYFCRAVKERSSECDERANWKIYVIKDTGHSLYGSKKWFIDENGNQTFIYYDYTASKLYLLNYIGTGSKNNNANWVSTDLLITVIGTGANFNIDFANKYIFTLNQGAINLVIYSGTNSLSNLQNPAGYVEYPIANITSASETSYIDGVGSIATIAAPIWLQKITVSGEERYYFGNGSTDTSNSYIKFSYLRYFAYRGADPTLQDSWVFDTEIVVSNNSILADGTWVADTSTNVNGASQGLLYIDNLGWVSMFIYGVKLFDFTNKVITILSGQEVVNGDLVIDNFMDTQYEYLLTNCESGSDE